MMLVLELAGISRLLGWLGAREAAALPAGLT